MKTYYLDELNFKNIMERLDDVGDESQIYINSGGGSTWSWGNLLERLELLNSQGKKIKLIGIFLGSRAFHLFYKYTGEKVLGVECEGVVHLEAINCHIANNVIRGDGYTRDSNEYFKNLPSSFEYTFMTEQEKEKYDNGYDVYLSPQRMKEIFKKDTD